MADKAISELTAATAVTTSDLFVLEQAGTAKKLSGQTLTTYLLKIVEAHGGISGIAKTGTSGLVDTYTITYADETTSTFTITNGAKGDTGDAWYVHIKYSSSRPTKNSDIYDIPDNWIGIYSGTIPTAPTDYTAYDWFEIKGATGATGAAAAITSQSVQYTSSTSGTVIPSGTWADEVPNVQAGNYLWTRTTITFNSGTPVVAYGVSRMGMDGSGSVVSVNGESPDASGNVTVTGESITLNDASETTISAALEDVSESVKGKQPLTNTLDNNPNVQDSDEFPFYDTSMTAPRKATWAALIARIREKLFGTSSGFLKADGSGNVASGLVNMSDLADGAVTRSFTATLLANGWTADASGVYTQTITVTGMLESDENVLCDIYAGNSSAANVKAWSEAWSFINGKTKANQAEMFFAEQPSIDIPVRFIVWRR